jgi:serine O-acetyltransferase
MTDETNKLGLLETLRTDMRAMDITRFDWLAMVFYFFKDPCFLAVLLFRLSSACVEKGKVGNAVAWFLWRLNILVNGCKINPHAKIAEGFSITYPIGVVIGRVIIGRNVEIYQHVTIGDRRRNDPYTGPNSRAWIGENVTIYTGAVLAGGVKIGKGASIGANAVVLKDVPENCLAVGVPARIIEKKPEELVAAKA